MNSILINLVDFWFVLLFYSFVGTFALVVHFDFSQLPDLLWQFSIKRYTSTGKLNKSKMLIYFIYSVLEAIANGIYTTVATISSIEQALINLMMSTFLFVLGIACHPVMVIPMMLGGYYILRNFWNRRTKTPGLQSSMDGDAGLITAGAHKEPRIPSYRSFAVGIDAPKDN